MRLIDHGSADTRTIFQEQVAARPVTEVWGRRAMVRSMHPDAAHAGVNILRAGGC
jgi:gamma-glutamyltranspeptidase